MKRIPRVSLLVALLCVSVLYSGRAPVWAGNAHSGTSDVLMEQRAWWGDAMETGYVVETPANLCLHSLSATTTVTIASCRAYVLNIDLPRQLEYVEDTVSRTFGYQAGNGIYQLAVHATIGDAVAGWTRVIGTHYIYQLNTGDPIVPNRALWLATVTVSGAAVTALVDRRIVGLPLSERFLDLSDTPDTYIGQALKAVRVNAAATALEFSDIVGSTEDHITVGGIAVDTTANFIDTGDIDFVWTDGPVGGPDTVHALIRPDSITAAMLADADHGLVAWSANVATVQGLQSGNTFPVSPVAEDQFWLLTAGAAGQCIAGAGSARSLCYWTGSSWESALPSVVESDTLQSVVSRGATVSSAISSGTAVKLGGSTHHWFYYQDGAGVLRRRACDTAGTTCTTPAVQAETSSDFQFINESGTTCGSFDSVTMAWTPVVSGTCAPNLVSGVTANQGLATGGIGGTTLGLQDCAAEQVLRRNAADTAWECVAATGTLGSQTTPIVTIATNPYPITLANCGAYNRITTGAGEIDLLATPTGCLLCFYQANAVTTLLDPDSTDTIDACAAGLCAGTALASGDRLQIAAAQGNQWCLMGVSATAWEFLPGLGVAADAN